MSCLTSPSTQNPLRTFCIAALVALAAVFSTCAAAEGTQRRETRTALVIGNAVYANASLRNPVNDAEAVAETLRQSGFQVTLKTNGSRRELNDALRQFFLASLKSDVRLIFFAGHGIQSKGRNYLLPVDAQLLSENDLAQQAVDMSEFLERLATVKSGVNVVILDACRNNPFGAVTARLADARLRSRSLIAPTATAGLAPMNAPGGTLVAFSTSPGSVALDGTDETHSIYTKHLLRWLNKPGLPIERVFKQVRIAVAHETQYQQVPWETSSLMGEFCIRTGENGDCGNL